MKNQVYLYPIWVRLWHLLNALLFLTLIVTGLSLQYSSNDYSLIRFDWAISIHDIAGIALCVAYIFYLFSNRFTSNGTYYQFHLTGMLVRVLKQLRYYSIGIFKNEDAPYPISIDRKFNPLQKISYVIVMYVFMPIIVITGTALFFPEILPTDLFGISGIHIVDLIHIVTGFALSIFMAVHIYFCTIGKTALANFKSMINGWH
ncbi:MAG: cytochrome b/b6 domain-containing protein [Bacteroidetes bacterium]|nr:cytochrome b/b6 domain-containing protein [Bacteroidota bacterium]MBL6944940.1 cytochrome b/b6 domain-containing protein [Bacteroidales bacterium]